MSATEPQYVLLENEEVPVKPYEWLSQNGTWDIVGNVDGYDIWGEFDTAQRVAVKWSGR